MLLTLVVFWPAVSNGFVSYDDPGYVTSNRQVQAGLTRDGVGWAFTTGYTGYWHPLTWLSLMADVQVGGRDPAVFHRTSVVLHAVNVGLLVLVLHAMTGSLWRAAAVGVVWGVHPLRVESVAWVAERKDVLSAMFGLLALAAYVLYVARPGVGRYVLVAACFGLSLMAKPMLVTLPALLLVLDYWPLRRAWGDRAWGDGAWGDGAWGDGAWGDGAGRFARGGVRKLVAEKAPLLVLSLAVSVATVAAQKKYGATVGFDEYGPADRVANSLVGYVRYIEKSAWFGGLTVFYPLEHWSVGQAAGAAAVLAAVTALAVWQARRRPWVAAGWLWFLGMLFPVIGLFQSGGQAMADRYSYLASVGLLVMVGWSVPGRWFDGSSTGRRLRIGEAVGLFASVVVVLAYFTRVQIGYWKDDLALFGHALAVTHDNALAESMESAALDDSGQPREGELHARAAVRIAPLFHEAWTNLGKSLMDQNRPSEALAAFDQAIRLDPAYATAHNNRGNALVELGSPREAETEYRRAIEIEPDEPRTHVNLGAALVRMGRLDEGVREYQTALTLDPDDADAHLNLGNAMAAGGHYAQAVAEYDRVLQLRPDDSAAAANRGKAIALERGG